MSRVLLRNVQRVALSRPQCTFSYRHRLSAPVFSRTFSDTKPSNEIHTAANPSAKNDESPENLNNEQSSQKHVMKVDFDEYDDYAQEPQTPKEKFKAYSAMFMRLALLGLGGFCVYLTAKELFPGRMNPNSLFSEVFEKLRYNEQVMEMVGDEARAFGRDVGRNTEGRRNHVDSYKYKAEDGKERLRIRMNIKGTAGQVRIWAEVQEGSKDDEFVYLILQNVSNGRVLTLVDRRDEIEAGLGTNAGDDSIAKFFSLKK
jgi:hypothetical protein